MRDEWKTSAHARAVSSPSYQAMKTLAGTDRCDRCHAPLARYIGNKEPAVAEGVTCDVCHNIKEVKVGDVGSAWDVNVVDMVKYGPLCPEDEVKDHYFHRMGCSPLHRGSDICAACHNLTTGDGVPVFTTYAEWKAGPYAAKDEPCQSCHMPGERAEVATGAGERKGVPHHGLLGLDGALRKTALTVTVDAARDGDSITATVELANTGAGHAVPAGLPARRIEVRATVGDANQTASFGKVLEGRNGQVAPFFHAVKVREDTRVPAGQSRTASVSLPAGDGGELHVEVVWLAFAPEVAEAAGIADVDEHVLAEVRVPLSKLPKKVTAKR